MFADSAPLTVAIRADAGENPDVLLLEGDLVIAIIRVSAESTADDSMRLSLKMPTSTNVVLWFITEASRRYAEYRTSIAGQ